jgi:hypothetical protein
LTQKLVLISRFAVFLFRGAQFCVAAIVQPALRHEGWANWVYHVIADDPGSDVRHYPDTNKWSLPGKSHPVQSLETGHCDGEEQPGGSIAICSGQQQDGGAIESSGTG